MAYKDLEKKREYDRVYNATHKEEMKKHSREFYLKHREEIIQRTTQYHHEHREERRKWYAGYYQKIRLEVLAKVNPDMKCAMCGCEDTRFLEVNHIKGGGNQERQGYKKDGHDLGHNMILLLHKGKRDFKDLNLLCRACNSIDHLDRQFGKTGLRVVWDKHED